MRTLPSFSITAFSDASEQERGLVGWDQRYMQMGSGRFEGTVVSMDFGRVSISEERLNVSVAETTAPPVGKVVLILPAPAPDSRINGARRASPGGSAPTARRSGRARTRHPHPFVAGQPRA